MFNDVQMTFIPQGAESLKVQPLRRCSFNWRASPMGRIFSKWVAYCLLPVASCQFRSV